MKVTTIIGIEEYNRLLILAKEVKYLRFKITELEAQIAKLELQLGITKP